MNCPTARAIAKPASNGSQPKDVGLKAEVSNPEVGRSKTEMASELPSGDTH
jgi:hypothetical protein